MAMHYFHMLNGKLTADLTGSDFADLAAVRREALRAARDMLNLGAIDEIWQGEPWKILVTDKPTATSKAILTIEVMASCEPAK
jgi:hypothetical protein